MKKSILLLTMLTLTFIVMQADKCVETNTADKTEQIKQESLQSEAIREVGMPNVHNFQEKKMVKMLYELRDNPNLINYAYLWSEVSGKWIFFGKCIGYGIPYSTEFSNPLKTIEGQTTGEFTTIGQSEPNGLFMPSSSEGTWLMIINPDNPSDIKPVYVEPKVIVSPFLLKNQ